MTVPAVSSGAPSWARRLAAVAALALVTLAVSYLVLQALHRWNVLLLSVASLGTTVMAAWYVLSRRGTARAVAAGLAVTALLVFAVVVVASESVRVLLVGLGLAVVSVLAAAYALRPATTPSDAEPPGPSRATRPVLLINMGSGGGKAERFQLVDRCKQRGIEPIVLGPGDDLQALAEGAIAGGADVIGMAGGDGSQAVVASVASRCGIPLVVVPAGTRNHFALDLGLDRNDIVGALDAFSNGVDRRVDLAEVNGRVFVNNAAMGVYAKVVQSSEYRDAKIHTAASMLPELLGPGTTPMDLRLTLPSGQEATTAQLILVSNNPYELNHLRGGGTRARMDGGLLGIVSVLVRHAADAEKLTALKAVGRVQRFGGWQEWTATELEVRSGAPVDIGVDGEALTLQPPLHFVVHPAALTVRVPRSAVAGSPAARAVRVVSRSTLAALVQTALGRPPRDGMTGPRA